MNIDYILQKVQKAVRYTGGEFGSVVKPLPIGLRFAFCFPDVYEVGMSHLGMKILYHQLNQRDDVWVERVFTPWVDMQEQMREHHVPLFSLESRTPVGEFDMVGFTLQYEMSYTNILNMLDLSGIPMLSCERENGPFVCAGGPCAFNPEPLAPFIDFFVIGEGEEVTQEVMDCYLAWKNAGKSRKEFLIDVSRIEGIYVPSFYEVTYREDGTILEYIPKEGAPKRVKKRLIEDLDRVFYPEELVVPFGEIVHDRAMIELFRGCIRGCRFCQAGMIYRPVRERSPERLATIAQKLMENTGYEELSMTSLSSSDYSGIGELTGRLLDLTEGKRVNLALPSLRVDSFTVGLMEKVQNMRKSSLTFAPEAGTQRLRDIINKGLSEEDILTGVRLAFEGGWSSLKLYFMIGLPGETMEDVEGIALLAKKIADEYYSVDKMQRGKALSINVSVSTFVPKPFTPFQWEGQDAIETMRQKQQMLREKIRSKHTSFHWHESKTSVLEAAFSRGDRRLAPVLFAAYQKGCCFDGWDEFFDYQKWMQAFEECSIDHRFYTQRKRSFDEVLPWDVVDCGVSKHFLKSECEKAFRMEVTPNCRQECSGCGVGC